MFWIRKTTFLPLLAALRFQHENTAVSAKAIADRRRPDLLRTWLANR